MSVLSKEEMTELIGQFVDVVEDFLEYKKEKMEENGVIAIIEGDDYDMLATKFKRTLVGWGLAEEKPLSQRYQELVDAAEMEEWNTPTD